MTERLIQKSARLRSLRASAGLMAFLLTHPGHAQTWTQTTAPIISFRAIACSADGRVIVAGGAALYVSTNYGVTWISNSVYLPNCLAVASSADGRTLAAADSIQLLTSTNTGASWQSNSVSTGTLGTLACSADGSVLALAAYSLIYISTNSGGTWLTNHPAVPQPPLLWMGAISLSADGRTMLAVNDTASNVFILSTNLGRDWAFQGAIEDGIPARVIAASADCVRLATANINLIYTSTNGGATWRANTFPVPDHFLSVASSADGLRLAVANYTSTNSGLTWVSNNAPHAVFSIASSADGRRLVAVSGGIWTYYSPGPPMLDITPANDHVTISWLIPSTDFVLEENSDLDSTNWTAVAAARILNTTNLHYEVDTPISRSSVFYRLRMR